MYVYIYILKILYITCNHYLVHKKPYTYKKYFYWFCALHKLTLLRMLTFKVLPLMPTNSVLASMIGVRGEAKRGIDNAINTIRQVGDNLICTYWFTLHFDVDNLAFYFYWLVISLAG